MSVRSMSRNFSKVKNLKIFVKLTHFMLVTPYGVISTLVLGDGSLPYSTEPLPEPVMTNQQRSLVSFLQERSTILATKIR